MNVVYKDIEHLILYVNNPRKNDHAIDKVASSIKNFGFKVPIVIDTKNEIISGHTRVKACKKLNINKIPCIIADDLTEAQIKAFRIADNRVAQESEWDMELLNIEIETLKELDFDIDNLGFDDNEIIDIDDLTDSFTFPDGDKEPFQQMTFTLADTQAERIKTILKKVKSNNNIETYGNDNSNGNAIYKVVIEWAEQKKL